MIGYKLLRADLSSLSDEHGWVQYGPDWVEVPGHGAYVALTLPGLLRRGLGDVLARVEYADLTGAVEDGDVVTARRVRVLQHVPVDIWAVVRAAIWGARQVLPSEGHPLRAACLQAVEAAERCERERTPKAAEAARAARRASWLAGTAEEAARWAAEAVKQASWAAAESAKRASRAAPEAVSWAAEAARAAAWAVKWAPEGSRETDLARCILEQVMGAA